MTAWKIGVIALAVLAVKADTVTTRDSRSWNGHLEQIQGGVLDLRATFPSGSAKLRFGANYVRAIEFNTTTYNAGANPAKLLPQPKGVGLSGTIYMLDKTPHKCANITVDSEHVSCDGKSLDRQKVMRILVDPPNP